MPHTVNSIRLASIIMMTFSVLFFGNTPALAGAGECSSRERCGPLVNGAGCLSWSGSRFVRTITNRCNYSIRMHIDIDGGDDCEVRVPANGSAPFNSQRRKIRAFELCSCG